MALRVSDKRPKKIHKALRVNWHRFQRMTRRTWFRWLTWPIAGIVVITGLVVLLNPVLFPPLQTYNFGVSFSQKRALEKDLDWRANYLALLDDLEIRKFRLMSYWDMGEPDRGNFQLDDLDWQMDEAAKRDAKVSLAIGLRQPRWPECHEPAWAKALDGHEWKQALYAYIEVIVKRYEDHPALESWQLENEFFNEFFGPCDKPDRERLYEEIDLVRELSDKPLWLSLADQHGLPIRGPAPDKYGYSVYRIVYNDNVVPFYMWYPTPLWYHNARTAVIKLMHPGSDFFIHELQLEPWGHIDTSGLTIEEQNISMSQDQIRRNVRFAAQLGMEDMYAWGAEWWYWRKEKFGDYSIWEAVRREVHLSRNADEP
jgi:hypothetical protein